MRIRRQLSATQRRRQLKKQQNKVVKRRQLQFIRGFS